MRDEDEDKDEILKQLGGEVDDFAGSKLPDPNAGKGVTVTIAVSPGGSAKVEQPEEDDDTKDDANMEAGNEEHDPIAHILGMCSGGCPE